MVIDDVLIEFGYFCCHRMQKLLTNIKIQESVRHHFGFLNLQYMYTA